MKVDLKGLTRRQLERLRADVDKAVERLADTEKKEALRAAEKAAKAHGYSLDELTGVKAAAAPKAKSPRKPAKKAVDADGRAKVAPKFRNPANPDETWSGRGRSPKWMAEHLEAGGSKEDLAI
jgi:DNA-binding protein H-NS